MTKVLMVKGWKSNATWGFPKGKINKDEPDDLCAIREVYEEIGFDIGPYLCKTDYIDITIRRKNFKLFIIRGVPGSTKFCPQTRKEISKIEWHDVKTLPAFSSEYSSTNSNQYFLVAPFMHGLAKYIAKKRGLPTALSSTEAAALTHLLGGSTSSNETKFIDKDAAASELLNMLKSSKNFNESGAQDKDEQVVRDLFKNSETNEAVKPDIDSAQELLSLLKTEIDRTNEEATLEAVTEGSTIAQNAQQASTNNSEAQPQMAPQQLYPPNMPYGMPYPNMPYPQMMPMNMMNGGVPMFYPSMYDYRLGMAMPPQQMGQFNQQQPVPFPAPQEVPPVQPSPRPSSVQPAEPQMSFSGEPPKKEIPLPPPPKFPTSQPTPALMALLSKSRTKRQVASSSSSNFEKTPSTLPPVPTGPSSSSKALLSLLHMPGSESKPPTPSEVPKEPEIKPNEQQPSSIADLFMSGAVHRQQKLDEQKNDTDNTQFNQMKPDIESSKSLLSMIKGNNSIENNAEQEHTNSNNVNKPNDFKSQELLSLIKSSVPDASQSSPNPQISVNENSNLATDLQNQLFVSDPASNANQTISLKDQLFGNFTTDSAANMHVQNNTEMSKETSIKDQIFGTLMSTPANENVASSEPSKEKSIKHLLFGGGAPVSMSESITTENPPKMLTLSELESQQRNNLSANIQNQATTVESNPTFSINSGNNYDHNNPANGNGTPQTQMSTSLKDFLFGTQPTDTSMNRISQSNNINTNNNPNIVLKSQSQTQTTIANQPPLNLGPAGSQQSGPTNSAGNELLSLLRSPAMENGQSEKTVPAPVSNTSASGSPSAPENDQNAMLLDFLRDYGSNTLRK